MKYIMVVSFWVLTFQTISLIRICADPLPRPAAPRCLEDVVLDVQEEVAVLGDWILRCVWGVVWEPGSFKQACTFLVLLLLCLGCSV